MLVLVCFTVSICFHASLNLAAIALERKCPDVVFLYFQLFLQFKQQALEVTHFVWVEVSAACPGCTKVALHFKRSFYGYASQYSLGLILTEVPLDITEIAPEIKY